MNYPSYHRPAPSWAELAQQAGLIGGMIVIEVLSESGADGGLFKAIANSLKTASPPVALILLWMYLRADGERREAQRQTNERTIDYVQSTNGAVEAVDNLANAISPAPRRRRSNRKARAR